MTIPAQAAQSLVAAPVPFTDLDAMLTPEECATWLRVSLKELKSNKAIRPISLGYKTKRYHPRTVIEQLKQSSNLCLK